MRAETIVSVTAAIALVEHRCRAIVAYWKPVRVGTSGRLEMSECRRRKPARRQDSSIDC